MKEKDFWMGFSVFSGIGSVYFQHLLSAFGTAKKAWQASEQELKEVLKEKKTKDFLQFRDTFNFAEYKKKLEAVHVSMVVLGEAAYPSLLKQIPRPPFVLYIKGNSNLLLSTHPQSQHTIAVVGTRKITQYGKDVTEMFTKALVKEGFMIISGLAMGVDAVAHRTALEQGGKTIGVLGCGVDCCYPRENEKLYDDIIASGGAVISEIPLGMSATVGTFPARNRIVAGLSQGVLVTEGAEGSGALITAEFSVEYGRKAFAVLGPITSSLSKGPYKLIEKGGKLVTKSEDILQELGSNEESIKDIKRIKGDTKEEQLVIDVLQNESLSFDEIVRKIRKGSAEVGVILSLMEVKGCIKMSANGEFSIAK